MNLIVASDLSDYVKARADCASSWPGLPCVFVYTRLIVALSGAEQSGRGSVNRDVDPTTAPGTVHIVSDTKPFLFLFLNNKHVVSLELVN